MKQGRRTRFVGRGRERAWRLLGAAVFFAVLFAIAPVLGWPAWTLAVLAGLAAAAALTVPELRTRAGQDDTWTRLVDQRMVISGGRRRLLQVRDVELDQLRVHAARVQVSYIERDQQNKLEAAVGPGKAALVVGHSMSGKTQMAAEVIKQKFPDALLVAAESGKDLLELFNGGLDPTGTVVWLDDLERFLGADGLTVGLLNRLTTGRAIVVATIRVEEWEKYRPKDNLRPPQWEVLQQFSEVPLQRRISNRELGLVRAMVNDPGVLTAVEHYGLAEYLGAGPEALDKFEKGEIANPVGYALVRAAIDWRRTGFTRPISKQVLVTTLPTYLAGRPDVPRTNQAIDEGLAWATAKINETVALLGQVFTGSSGPVFEVFDYLIDQLTLTSTPVPDPMWTLALEQAESAELIAIGLTAYQAGKTTTATTAWRQAIDRSNAKWVSWAIWSLGDVLMEQGDFEGAKAAYQQVIDSGHAEELDFWRMLDLGKLLEKRGDFEGAKAAYQQTIDSGHPDVAPRATLSLGEVLEKQYDFEGAEAAYQRAINTGHSDVAPEAICSLGDVLKKRGDFEGAKAAYQRAIDSGDAGVVFRAICNLLDMLEEQGDSEGVKAAYQRAIDSGDVRVASRAMCSLGKLLKKQGDFEGAKAAYQRAIDTGDTVWASSAAVDLGKLLEKQGDFEGAKAAYQRAIDTGDDTSWASWAMFDLGRLLEKRSDFEGAKAAYQQTINSSDAGWASLAMLYLGKLLEKQGDFEGAKAAYQRAIDTGRPTVAPEATLNLERLLRSTSRLRRKRRKSG